MLARIDLSRANLALFEEYEAKVLALLEQYGGKRCSAVTLLRAS